MPSLSELMLSDSRISPSRGRHSFICLSFNVQNPHFKIKDSQEKVYNSSMNYRKLAWVSGGCLAYTWVECFHSPFLLAGEWFLQSLVYPEGWLSATSEVFPHMEFPNQGAHSFSVVSPILSLPPLICFVENPLFSSEQMVSFGSSGTSQEREPGSSLCFWTFQ